ncbi:hypothetical protein BGZ95_003155, partial [Linnemannia exigua]
MFTRVLKEKTESDGSHPTASSPSHAGSTRVKESRFVQLEQATKNLFRSSIRKKDRTEPNPLATIQCGSIGVLVPQDHQDDTTPVSVGSSITRVSVEPSIKDLPSPQVIPQQHVAPFAIEPYSNKDLKPLASVTLQSTSTPSTPDSSSKAKAAPDLLAAVTGDRMNIFLQNIVAPSLKVPLPPPGVHLETTMQLAYCNQLLRTHLSPSLAVASTTAGLDPFRQASVDALLKDEEGQNKVRELAIRVVEEFMADSLKCSEEIAEVVLLGPYLDQEYYRKLLNCFIAEFEATKLLDIDLLQGLVQLVQSAGPDYLQPDSLARVL